MKSRILPRTRPTLVGIDLGTTGLKAAAYCRETGQCLASAGERLAVRTPEDHAIEQDAGDLIGSLKLVLGSLREQTGDLWSTVEGIGFAAQGGSTVVVTGEDARPLTPVYLWNDFRCFKHFERIRAQRPREFWRSFSLRNDTGLALARLAWLRERCPALFTPGHLCVGVGELVFHALTGVWRQDGCHAQQAGCYDVRRNSLAPEPLALLGLDPSFFSPLRQGHETHPLTSRAAGLFGLPAGIPVAGPYNDHEAGYVAAAHLSERPLQCSLGTAWVGNFVVEGDLPPGSGYQLPVPSPKGDGLLVVQALLTGNQTWDWGLHHLLHNDHKTALRALDAIFDERLLPPPGLICLPWMGRPNPLADGHGAGAFFGISTATDANDLLRAIAAGMTMEFFRIFNDVIAQGLVDSLVLSGGAGRGREMQRLFGALAKPLPVVVMSDPAAMGTRGCLAAFDSPAAQGPASPAVMEPAPDPEALRALRGLYGTLAEKLYSQEPSGCPFLLQ